MQITGSVRRTYTAEKFGKLTLEVKGSGKYPDILDFKTFGGPSLAGLKNLGQGEVVTVDFEIQTEKVRLADGTDLTETGKNGTAYPVKVPMLKITAVASASAGANVAPEDTSSVPF